MATNSVIRAEHEASNSDKKEEEEEDDGASTTDADDDDDDDEEALSLCDLPDKSDKEDNQTVRKADSSQQEEFDFLLWAGPFSKEPSQMCVADEVFFQGQILPLCSKSFNASNPSLPTSFNRSGSSTSESLTSEFRSSSTSSSSRSSSIRSQNSSSTSSIITNPQVSKPNMQNHHQHHHHRFHSHPSPKPHQAIKSSSSSRQVSFGGHNMNRKSSKWDFFRLGVAPAPEIELKDLKFRCTNNSNNKKYSSVSRNSSNSSSSDKSNVSNSNGFRNMVMRGCKCSVETVPFDVMISKGNNNKKAESSTTHAMKEKVRQHKQRRKAMSRHRTFEWLKELSHAESYSYKDDDEEALLSKSLICNLT